MITEQGSPDELILKNGRYSNCEPISYLLSQAKPTHIPCVYLNREPRVIRSLPWVVDIMGPSGAGKNAVLAPLIERKLVSVATTATTRARRINIENQPDEPDDAYIWMRGKKNDETHEEYVKNLVIEYELIEHDVFYNGNVYGLPLKSLENAMTSGVAVLTGDNHAVAHLSEVLEGKANLLAVFIVPDSYAQLHRRMQGRGNEDLRMQKAVEYVLDAPRVSHYYLHNSETAQDGSLSGLSVAQRSLERLIHEYCFAQS